MHDSSQVNHLSYCENFLYMMDRLSEKDVNSHTHLPLGLSPPPDVPPRCTMYTQAPDILCCTHLSPQTRPLHTPPQMRLAHTPTPSSPGMVNPTCLPLCSRVLPDPTFRMCSLLTACRCS